MPFDNPIDQPTPVRWTSQSINKALRCPKPKGAIRAYDNSVAARGVPLGRLLAHIVAHADIIDDGRCLDRDSGMADHCGAWLLVPLPADLLDQLLNLGAEYADLEPDPDIEPDHDGEPSLGTNETVSQIACWGQRPVDIHRADLEDDQIDEGTNADDEASDPDGGNMMFDWTPDWQPWTFRPSEDIAPAT